MTKDTKNMQGYYCDPGSWDNFHPNISVRYGSLFGLAVAISCFLLLDVIYELLQGRKYMNVYAPLYQQSTNECESLKREDEYAESKNI